MRKHKHKTSSFTSSDSQKNNYLRIVSSLVQYGFYVCIFSLLLNILIFLFDIFKHIPNQNFYQFFTSYFLFSAILLFIIGFTSMILYSFFLIKTEFRNKYKIIVFDLLIGIFLLVLYFHSGLS